MTAPTKVNFKMYQGATFKEVLRKESEDIAYAPITGITKAAPVVITSTAHGIPTGWRTRVTNVSGMTDINNSETYHIVSASDTNSVTINKVNSLSYKDYVSGGVLEYYVPSSLNGVSARMQIRTKLDSTTVIEDLTTENGKILIDNVLKTITILIDATTTATYTFQSAVYSMELIVSGEVVPFIYGDISLVKEITR